ncbi:MAG: hypothetical protein FJ254_09615 [Phycisphaerae bacterium]|nr:hypothetical protein [Phycisphaerae bacterium]
MPLRPTTCIAIALAATLPAVSPALAQTIHGTWLTPTLDRWMYPFNTSPGSRPVISVFGSDANDPFTFDSRDGQFLVGWLTADQVPMGTPASSMTLQSASVEVEFANDLLVQYDPTQDPWQIFAPTTSPDWQADSDPGQSIELHGVGFRNGFTAASFSEFSPFAPGGTNLMAPSVRSAYAMSFNGAGQAIDVSNNPREHFDPKAFAVGACATLQPGDLIPAGTRMNFQIDVNDPNIRHYVLSGLASGKLLFTISSLSFVVQQGGNFPAFYAKEHAFVTIGAATAAQLRVAVTIAPPCAPADLDCNQRVDGADLGLLLSNWGGAGSGDVDGSGQVDGADLGSLLSSWTG